MPTRNIALTETQNSFVGELVASGRYQSASEVMRDGLRLLENEMARRAAEIEDIRAGVLEGLAQAESGDFADGSGADAIRRAFSRARESPAR